MYPTLAKDKRTTMVQRMKEERVCIYTKTAYTLHSLQGSEQRERDRHTSLAWDGFWHRLGQFFKAPEPAGTKTTARLSACLEKIKTKRGKGDRTKKK